MLKGQHPLLNAINSYHTGREINSASQSSLLKSVFIEGKDIPHIFEDSKKGDFVEALNDESTSENEAGLTFEQGERTLAVAITGEAGENLAVENSDSGKGTEEQDLDVESPSEGGRTLSDLGIISSESEDTNQETESNSSKPSGTSPKEDEPEIIPDAIQMRAAAESVMNVLDITMPGTLSHERKVQVLKAVGEGQTILTALEEAVPEHVRGSMAAAVSGAVQARGLSFNLVGFGKNKPPPKLPAGLIENIKGSLPAVSGEKAEPSSSSTLVPADQSISGVSEDILVTRAASCEKVDGESHADPVTRNNKAEEANNQGGEDIVKQEVKNKLSGEVDSEKDLLKAAPKDPSMFCKMCESEKPRENTESKVLEVKCEETGDNQDVQQAGDTNNIKAEAEEPSVMEATQQEDKNVEITADTNCNLNVKDETNLIEESTPSPATPNPLASATPPSPAPTSENTTRPDHLISSKVGVAPPLDMRLAFQALTGFDDSTQMAVTNVFGVVENVLEKLQQEHQGDAQDASVSVKGASDDQESNNGKEGMRGEKSHTIINSEGSGKEDGSNKNNEKGNSKEEDESKKSNGKGNVKEEGNIEVVSDSFPPEHNEKGRVKKEAILIVKDLKRRVHGGCDGQNTLPTTKGQEKQTAAEVDGEKQDAYRKVNETKSAREDFQQVKVDQEHVVNSSSMLLSRDFVQRAWPKVMPYLREENCTLTEPILKKQSLASPSDDRVSSVNDASVKYKGASTEQKGFETQHTQQVRKPDNTTPIISKQTVEQLSRQLGQASTEDGGSFGVVEMNQDDGTIEAEVTEVKETKAPRLKEHMLSNALKLEFLRRLGVVGMGSLKVDIDQDVVKVTNVIAAAVQKWKGPRNDGLHAGKLGTLPSDSIMSIFGSLVGGTRIVGDLVPIGMLAGVVLASVGAVYLIFTGNHQGKDEDNVKTDDGEKDMEEELEGNSRATNSDTKNSLWHRVKVFAVDVPVLSVNRHSESPLNGFSELEDPESQAVVVDKSTEDRLYSELDRSSNTEEKITEGNKQSKIMGAMVAAATGGATQAGMKMPYQGGEEPPCGQDIEDLTKNTEKDREKVGIISTFHPLAEKALLVAAPVVLHKEDGEIDHERLVAMLAGLGQRGGFFRLIGKVALLWGGLRGAMRLTDRLLVFLQLNRRPLHLRIVGFAAMTILLWSPVLIPLLPALLQQWATKAPSGVADAASVVGLYGAILILVTIWGNRVRGYNKPLLYYGLRFWSKRKVQDFGLGLAMGCGMATFLYSTNFILGYAEFNWKALLVKYPKLPGAAGVAIFTAGKVTKLVGQAVGIGLAVALVEVLFRAWLQEEIAVDLGFHRAVFISAAAFAVVHGSPPAMPGLWFSSVGLAGALAKMNRNLAFPIGIHAGLMAINNVMTVGGVVRYFPDAPTWITGAHVGNPLAGAIGTTMMLLLAVTMYPRTSTPPLLPSKEAQQAV